ncbi:MAG: phospho-N-acetylmuramoyl-pentapeptide-transferase [Planctomycetota bacterium]|jgi:phospho-N-acetylmuramoyl-pentapeptide-transferase
MLKYLALLSEDYYGPLRVFESITFRSAIALVFAFVFTLIIAPLFIKALNGLRVIEDVGKPDSSILEKLHQDKKHTPTMGGIIIVISILLTTLLFADPANPYVVIALFSILSFAGLGFIDDFVKLRKIGKSSGLSRTSKIIIQLALSLLIAMALSKVGDKTYLSKLLVPGTKKETFFPDLGVFYFPFFMLVLIGSSNAVNLTDGLDGLAAGCTTLLALSFTVMAYVAGHNEIAEYLRIPYVQNSGELTIFCSAIVGATIGFLWFNAHPARIFMGDTGSLALGAAIGFVALAVKQELVLLIAGGIFVWEAISVILQISSCKLTGKRPFKCAPYHHHLEFSGMHENHVVMRLWCVAVMLAVLGIATLKMH